MYGVIILRPFTFTTSFNSTNDSIRWGCKAGILFCINWIWGLRKVNWVTLMQQWEKTTLCPVLSFFLWEAWLKCLKSSSLEVLEGRSQFQTLGVMVLKMHQREISETPQSELRCVVKTYIFGAYPRPKKLDSLWLLVICIWNSWSGSSARKSWRTTRRVWVEDLSLNAGLIFALGTDFVRIQKKKPYVLGQMRMQRLSGRNLSFFFYAGISWKLAAP